MICVQRFMLYGEMWWNGKDCRQTTDNRLVCDEPVTSTSWVLGNCWGNAFLIPEPSFPLLTLPSPGRLLPPATFPPASAHLGSVAAVSRPVKLYLAVCRSRAEGEQLGSGGLDVGSSLVTLGSVTSWPRDSAGVTCDVVQSTEWPPDELWAAVTFSPDHVWCIIQSSETSNYDSKILESAIH